MIVKANSLFLCNVSCPRQPEHRCELRSSQGGVVQHAMVRVVRSRRPQALDLPPLPKAHHSILCTFLAHCISAEPIHWASSVRRSLMRSDLFHLQLSRGARHQIGQLSYSQETAMRDQTTYDELEGADS